MDTIKSSNIDVVKKCVSESISLININESPFIPIQPPAFWAKEQFNGFQGGFSTIGECRQYMPYVLAMSCNQFQQDHNMIQGLQMMQNPNKSQNPQMMPVFIAKWKAIHMH